MSNKQTTKGKKDTAGAASPKASSAAAAPAAATAPAKKAAAPAAKKTAATKTKKPDQSKEKASKGTSGEKSKKSTTGEKKSTVISKRGKVAKTPAVGAKAAKAKALKAQKVIKKGKFGTRVVKARYNVHFYRPKTKSLQRNPKYPRKSVAKKNPLNRFTILKYPLATESAMQQIENNSTLVFIVDLRANKRQIKSAVKKMYDVDCKKVNTLIRPDGKKKAYVRLTPQHDALEVANKIGII